MCVCAGPNAISVSMSPSNQYVMVGLASKRMMWAQVTDQVRSSRAVAPVSVVGGGGGHAWQLVGRGKAILDALPVFENECMCM